MPTFTIPDMGHWNILKAKLEKQNYKLWQMQYQHNSSEGFHAWFWKHGKEDVEMITFDEAVQNDVIKYHSKK